MSDTYDNSGPQTDTDEPLLNVQNLHTYFHTKQGTVQAVDGVDIQINSGEIVGIVGESGSGKTVTAKSLLRLINDPGEIVDGDITFAGKELLELSEEELRLIRGQNSAMIFQNVSNAFNPTKTLWWQLRKILKENTNLEDETNSLFSRLNRDSYPRDDIDKEISSLFAEVGIAGGSNRIDDYPHEFSGGMLQRALIAAVLGCKPDLIIADEPTTNLDVTVEAQILKLLWNIREELDTSILFITHDIGVVSEICDRVVVMYAGEVVEKAPIDELLNNPKHPYTQGLLSSIPRVNTDREYLPQMKGSVPNPTNFPDGCRFASRCPAAMEECYTTNPEMRQAENSTTACHLYDENDVEEGQIEVIFDG